MFLLLGRCGAFVGFVLVLWPFLTLGFRHGLFGDFSAFLLAEHFLQQPRYGGILADDMNFPERVPGWAEQSEMGLVWLAGFGDFGQYVRVSHEFP